MKAIKWNKTILIYGASVALILVALKYFEFRYFIGSFSVEVYLSVVAILFTVFGIWVGLKLVKKSTAQTVTEVESKSQHLQEITSLLNKREVEVLECIELGLSNKEIGEKLFIALPTVKSHVSNLYRKLDVKSRTQALHKIHSLQRSVEDLR